MLPEIVAERTRVIRDDFRRANAGRLPERRVLRLIERLTHRR